MIQSIIRHLRFLDTPGYLTLSALDEPLIPEEYWPEFLATLEHHNDWIYDVMFWFDDDEDGTKRTAHGSWFEKVLRTVNQRFIKNRKPSLAVLIETLLTEIEAIKPEAERDIREFRILCRKLLKKSGDNLSVLLDFLAFSEQEERETEEQRNYVHLLTLHGSKGRQFKKVFIAGVNASIIPDPRCDLEEERRLLYVGITRAEKELVISYYRNSFGHAEEPSPLLAPVLQSESVIFCPAMDKQIKYKKGKSK